MTDALQCALQVAEIELQEEEEPTVEVAKGDKEEEQLIVQEFLATSKSSKHISSKKTIKGTQAIPYLLLFICYIAVLACLCNPVAS